jgi:hypothetical protein
MAYFQPSPRPDLRLETLIEHHRLQRLQLGTTVMNDDAAMQQISQEAYLNSTIVPYAPAHSDRIFELLKSIDKALENFTGPGRRLRIRIDIEALDEAEPKPSRRIIPREQALEESETPS